MQSVITQQNIMYEIQNPANWKRTHHKIYEVYICKPPIGTQVFNRLEQSSYITNEASQFVVSGTQRELWVIDIHKLLRKYSFLDGKSITEDELHKRMKNGVIDWIHVKTNARTFPVWAFHIGTEVSDFPVTTSKGTVLLANATGVYHGIGDFILCSDSGGAPNFNDCWVVNGSVFPLTYDMRSFPNLSYDTTNTYSKAPTSILEYDLDCNVSTRKNKERHDEYRALAETYAKKLLDSYSRAIGKPLTHVNFLDAGTGGSGNYQMLEDYTYVDYKLTFYVNMGNSESPASMRLRFVEGRSIDESYLDVRLTDDEHNGNLRYEGDALGSVGIKISELTEAHLDNWIANQVNPKPVNKRSNSLGGIFKFFKRRAHQSLK